MKRFASFFSKAKTYALTHKAISAIVLLALVGGGYAIAHASGSAGETLYVLAQARRGTLVSSVAGSGQVEAVDQEDITSTVSGDIVSVVVKAGDKVVKDQPLAYIDTKDATKAVTNAQIALSNAQLSYDRAQKQAKDQTAGSASSDLAKSYQGGYTAIANASIDLPAIFAGASDIFYDPSHSPYFSDSQLSNTAGSAAVTYKYQAGVALDTAKRDFDANYARYKAISASSDPAEISALLSTTDAILKELLSALTGTYNTIDYASDRYASNVPTQIATDKTALSGYVSKVNSNINAIANAVTSIDDAQDSPASADLSLKTAELGLSQAKDALDQAREDLYNHTIRAPWDAVVAKVPAKVGDKANNGTSIATLISPGKLVRISLNEIDAAKVKEGDRATLTFDAIDGLSLPAHVSQMDLVGTVSQGVVTYSVEIQFDQNDERVKPGMTVSADIATASVENAILVPSAAVKSGFGGGRTVQVLSGTFKPAQAAQGVTSSVPPKSVKVEVAQENDDMAAISSGLSEGDWVVVRTATTGTAKTSTTPTATSLLGNINRAGRTGAGGAGGGNRTFGAPAGGAVFISR
jgi:RND family efflux transporter MFP subunit